MNRTYAYSRVNRSSGFTLLEMVFVLGIIAVLMTWLTLTVSTVETEDRLRRASGEIESMAKRARSVAVRQQRPYKLTISADSIAIAPLFHLTNGDNTSSEDSELEPESEDFEDIIASEKTDSEVKYEIKRWRSDTWLVIEDDQQVVLTLDPVGLVEPISIRCSVGESWLIQELHPLTAGVRDEEMSIEKE